MSDVKDATWIYLVRHGATDANLRKPPILQGRGINLPLNETGRRQAADVARFFENVPLTAVYASPLSRAQETARFIATSKQLDVATREELAEVDVGEWEGKDWRTIEQNYPEAYRAFHEDPGESPYFGGESYGDVYRRAHPVLATLAEGHPGESIAVVAHNVVNRTLLAGLLGMGVGRAKDIRQANACVNVLYCSPNTPPAVVTMNSWFHLDPAIRSF